MSGQNTADCVVFPDLFGRPLTAEFDLANASSDGGGVLLSAIDSRLGLIEELAGCIRDQRQVGKVDHEVTELLSQRIFGMALGYADCNDAARLVHDPVHRLLTNRDLTEGDALASQPTLSRFENSIGRRELYRMGEILTSVVVDRHRLRIGRTCRKVVIDLDSTADPTHGAQQLTLFNGHYDTWCYLPLLGFVSFDDEPEQYLFTAMLRPGTAPDKLGVLAVLRRIIPQLRSAFPHARILVRMDGGFGRPEILDFLDSEERVDYVVGFAKNSVLLRFARKLMGAARKKSRGSKRTEHVYGECGYQASKWSHGRRVIIKAEVVRLEGRLPKDNPRFVVTNLRQTPRWVYEHVYCERGDVENRIKELKYGLEIDRTSCSRFLANQFRVLLTAAAYVLLQELRLQAQPTSCARAQIWTLRQRLLTIGTQVVSSTRRLLFRLPESSPYKPEWIQIACALGARTG
jgi:Transposase DDE domain group 1